METINCIFCNHAHAQVAIQENNFDGKQCNDCKLIYISPRPSLQAVVDIYGHDQAYVSSQAHIQGYYLKRLYACHTLAKMQKYVKKGSLLEIGAGGGHFLDEARKRGFTPFGIELNTAQAAYITNHFNIPCSEKPLDQQTFGNQKFDIIYHCDVISHLHDPIQEIRTMYQKLKPHGWLIFETGNIGDIDKKYYKLFPAFQYPDHLFFFTEHNIRSLLEQSGFDVVKIYRYSIVSQLVIQALLKKLFGKKNNTKMSNQSSQEYDPSGLQKLYYNIVYFLRYKFGAIALKHKRPQTLIVVAQKK